jgi:hypothetical protein
MISIDVQMLLQNITTLQQNIRNGKRTKPYQKARIHKVYHRFCQDYEADVAGLAHVQRPPGRDLTPAPLGLQQDGAEKTKISCGLCSAPLYSWRVLHVHTQASHADPTGSVSQFLETEAAD